MPIRLDTQTKEERAAERAEWRKEAQEDRNEERRRYLEDRDYEERREIEAQRREDLLHVRGFWADTVQNLLDNGTDWERAIKIADRVVEEYKARFS